MSFKLIDLQLAINRNSDAALTQNKLSHKPSDDQASLAGLSQRVDDQNSKKSPEVNKSMDAQIQGENHAPSHQQEKQRRENTQDEAQTEKIKHPFKGQHIDLSL